jgi:putative transferase (TIGR04331 family)
MTINSKISYVVSALSYKKEYTNSIYAYEYLSDKNKEATKTINKENIKYLDEKYYYLLYQLRGILNKEHNKNFSSKFYQKSLGLGFRRFIHICYDAYLRHNNNFDSTYKFGLLSRNFFYTPNTFEEHRNFFQNTELGSEQLFSIYVDTFLDVEKKEFEIFPNKEQAQVLKKRKSSGIFQRFKNLNLDKIYRRFLYFIYIKKEPSIGIIGSYFSSKHLNKLILKSNGKIKPLDIKFDYRYTEANYVKRNDLFDQIEIIDDFDKFLKNCLIYSMPTFFIEDFLAVIKLCIDNLDKISGTEYLISENWISSTERSTFLAIAKDKCGVKHIYNEHNYFEHPYLGNHNYLIAEMVDIFFNIGWEDKKNKDNIISGASLFPFSINNYSYQEKGKILYVSASASAKIEEFNSAYGENGENGLLYFNFINLFFNNLKNVVYSDLNFRDYPSKDNWLEFSKLNYVNLTKIQHFDDFSIPAKEAMLRSKLVITDYMATSFLEALVMNIPSIFFWNQKTYTLDEVYSDFFKDLIDCGICQTNPLEAATFVNDLVKNNTIKSWWYCKKTQSLRANFLKQNIGNPKNALSFYLALTKNSNDN